MSSTVAAPLPATFTVMVLALVEVKVESMGVADKVSIPSPVSKVMLVAALAVTNASSVAFTLTVVAAFAVTVAWPPDVTRAVLAAAAVTVVSAAVVAVTTVLESVVNVPAAVAFTVAKTSVRVPGESSVKLVAKPV